MHRPTHMPSCPFGFNFMTSENFLQIIDQLEVQCAMLRRDALKNHNVAFCACVKTVI
jgi:hypothetical protein